MKDFKELLTNKFVEGRRPTQRFCFDSVKKITEEAGEVADAINNQEGPERAFSEMMDTCQAAYSCILVHEKLMGPELTAVYRKNWLAKQEKRIAKYNKLYPKAPKGTLSKEEVKNIAAAIIYALDMEGDD